MVSSALSVHPDIHADSCVLTATFYTPGVGSCGRTNTESDMIVAVDKATIQSFPGAGANPNKYVPFPRLRSLVALVRSSCFLDPCFTSDARR